jgi:DNA-binding NarL/FixJ family response regulator
VPVVRLLIVDDHEVVRQGLRVFLGSDPAIEIVGEAEDGAQALEAARQLQPDVVLMNLVMPRMDGVEATLALRKELPDSKVIILTSTLDEGRMVAAIRAGAVGYLLKDASAADLRTAIMAAADGQVHLAPQAVAGLMRGVRELEATHADAPGKRVDAQTAEHEAPLTERETEVLRLLSHGLANKEIAVQLNIGEQTVKSHVHNLLNKLGASSRTQAALYGVRLGLVNQEAES